MGSIRYGSDGDFFRSSPAGLDTYIAQNAVNFSGGQKQRISIARGLIRESDFYIFDDCFSALDYVTEKKIRAAIQEKLADRGVLVVAQRVATVRHAAEILVLEKERLRIGAVMKSWRKARRSIKKFSHRN